MGRELGREAAGQGREGDYISDSGSADILKDWPTLTYSVIGVTFI